MNMIFVVVIVLVIAITIVAGYKAVKQLNSAVKNINSVPQEAREITQTVEDKYVGLGDGLFLFLFALIWVIMIASAFFIDTHPFFFIISFFMIIISGFIGGHIANTYSEFEANAAISTEASSFIIIPFIFRHYVQLIIVMGILTAVALYAKLRSG